MVRSFIDQAIHYSAEYREAAFSWKHWQINTELLQGRIQNLKEQDAQLREQKYDRPQGYYPKSPLKYVGDELQYATMSLEFQLRNARVFEEGLDRAEEYGRQHYAENQAAYYQLSVILAKQAGVEIIVGGEVQDVDKTTANELLGIRERSITDRLLSEMRGPACMDKQASSCPYF